MLSNENQQIVTAYEVAGMSPEEIADDHGLELTAVKATLYQFSDVYREATKTKVELKFNEREREEAKEAIIRVMRTTQDEYLILRAAKYIRDDSEGRLDDPLKGLKSMNVNISIFNQQLILAREAKKRSKLQNTSNTPQIENKSIEVESEVVKAA